MMNNKKWKFLDRDVNDKFRLMDLSSVNMKIGFMIEWEARVLKSCIEDMQEYTDSDSAISRDMMDILMKRIESIENIGEMLGKINSFEYYSGEKPSGEDVEANAEEIIDDIPFGEDY